MARYKLQEHNSLLLPVVLSEQIHRMRRGPKLRHTEGMDAQTPIHRRFKKFLHAAVRGEQAFSQPR